jgi:hypothetical protein
LRFRDIAREGRGCKNIPLDTSQCDTKVRDDLGFADRIAPVSVYPRIFSDNFTSLWLPG